MQNNKKLEGFEVPFGEKKTFRKKVRIPKKTEWGDPLGFSNIHLSQNILKIEGDPLGNFFRKKSLSAEKNRKGGPFSLVRSLVCFRGSGRVLFFLFFLDALLRFECFEPP